MILVETRYRDSVIDALPAETQPGRHAVRITLLDMRVDLLGVIAKITQRRLDLLGGQMRKGIEYVLNSLTGPVILGDNLIADPRSGDDRFTSVDAGPANDERMAWIGNANERLKTLGP